MQTTIFNSKTTTTEQRRTAIDKYIETVGFVPEITRVVIYYILERSYYYEALEQFAPNEATRAAFSCYILYYEGHNVSERIKNEVPSIKHSLPDAIIHGYIRDAARYLFEMITADHNHPAPACQSNTNN